MTEKLYYKNAYTTDFFAEVISSEKCSEGYDTVLDATAFFPEEGGQSADSGIIGGARVINVYEKDGVVHHITDKELAPGRVKCKLDFDERFVKMQCHTAEHIICGIIHKLFGLSNVGFHLGADEVTFDVDGVLTREELDGVEVLANEVIFKNVEVTTYFPEPKELSTLEYRSKLDLTENVRIVKIGEYDSCACCAPHVARTGEIGLIKILDFMKHRGGLRITMVAGRRALADYRNKYENIKKISALTSAPQSETAEALERYISEADETRAALKSARLKIAELRAEAIEKDSGNAVFLLDDFTVPELIAFSNVANLKIDGITVAISGTDGDYKYVISSNTVPLSEKIKDINSSLSGRGGGRGNMMQGSFSARLSEIKEFFK